MNEGRRNAKTTNSERKTIMVKSNEFRDVTLRDAIRKATAVYDRSGPPEAKNQRRCNDLLLEQKFLDSQELARKAQDLSARAERTGEVYLQAFNEYDRLGCGEDTGFTGT